MPEHPPEVAGLTVDGCRTRQQRIRELMAEHCLDALLLADPGHVHYLTGYWTRTIFQRLLVMERDGPVTLIAPRQVEASTAADEIDLFESNQLNTLVDDQVAAALAVAERRLASAQRIGCDHGLRRGLLTGREVLDFFPAMLQARRTKQADEVRLLQRAAQASEAALMWVRRTLQPGVDEMDVFAGIHAAINHHAGEITGEMGNDFKIGGGNGQPRRRIAAEGEIGIYDISVVLRGYSSDMARSFVVGGKPTAQQRDARSRIIEVLSEIEANARPGTSCRQLYDLAVDRLEGYRAWTFGHHLGHGIGLAAHEAPRLNPHHDDQLQPGDVIAVEPALYHDELRGGMRIEQMYHVTPTGLERLTHFPTDL